MQHRKRGWPVAIAAATATVSAATVIAACGSDSKADNEVHNIIYLLGDGIDDPAEVKDGSPEASLWLTYLSGNHTGADVQIYAYGPGTQVFAANQDNTSLYTKMHRALLP
ncbi:alkaline phosphatase [Nocardia sp. NPDC051981]|uniref:alkaline phosphatase n=1 Tax=Nocardia sp. NPDC051981 TaxID=3155417 RepID=UPI0034425783